MSSNIIKGVVLPDLHYPNHNKNCLRLVEMFMKDFKPDEVLYLGDTMDMATVSHWNQENVRLIEGKRLKHDYDGMNDILDNHKKICPKHTKFTYFIGNHEAWIEDTISRNPQLEGFYELEQNLKFKERGFKVVEFNGSTNIGKLYFIHGLYTCENHAKKTSGVFERSIRYGHTHDIQFYTKISPLDSKDFHTASSIGCLCDTNPQYLKNRPSKWMHGFLVFYVDKKTGQFNDYQVVISLDQFVYGDKIYSVKPDKTEKVKIKPTMVSPNTNYSIRDSKGRFVNMLGN